MSLWSTNSVCSSWCEQLAGLPVTVDTLLPEQLCLLLTAGAAAVMVEGKRALVQVNEAVWFCC